MIGAVLQFHDLQDLCQPGKRPRRSTVEQWAKRQGVRYSYDADGGIWTTVDALNAAIGLTPASNNDAYDPDKVL